MLVIVSILLIYLKMLRDAQMLRCPVIVETYFANSWTFLVNSDNYVNMPYLDPLQSEPWKMYRLCVYKTQDLLRM